MIYDRTRSSRTVEVRVLDKGGNETAPPFLDIIPEIPTLRKNQLRTVAVEAGSPNILPNIAFRLLRDPSAWWAVAEASKILDPFTEVSPRKPLKVPTVAAFEFLILEQ